MSDRRTKFREEEWHLDKRFSVGTLIMLVTLIVTQVYQFAELRERVYSLEKQVNTSLQERVHPDVIKAMFDVRDDRIEALRQDIRDNNQLLREIRQAMLSHQTENTHDKAGE